MADIIAIARLDGRKKRRRFLRPRRPRTAKAWAFGTCISAMMLTVTGALTPGADESHAVNGHLIADRHFAVCASGKRITCVVDGDTLWLDGMKIRISDIDAPEASALGCDEEAELGRRATLRLVALLNDGPFEIKSGGVRDEDLYGRKLRRLVRNGDSLGAQLVSEGLARDWNGRRRSWC